MQIKYLVFISTIFQIQFSYCQDYMNYEKSTLISRLANFGFDTISGSEMKIVDSSNVVIAQFNENYCSKIEYHLSNDGDIDYCDSIFCTSTCINCFEVTLKSFLSTKSRKWKKDTEGEFYSLRNSGKSTLNGPPKEVQYLILKLEVANASEDGDPRFSVYQVWVTKDEFRRLKKILPYR